MDDVAREAGLSRTALYQHFANKEEILRALAANLYHRALATAEVAGRADGALEARIYGVLDAKWGFFYELLWGSEHGLEMLDEGNRLCGDVTADAGKRYQRILVRVLRNGETHGQLALHRIGLAPDSAAQFFMDCAEGLAGARTIRPTPEQYRVRLRQLVNALVAGFGGKAPGRRPRKAR